MFSLAVSIPYNSATEKYDLSKVTDTGDRVRERIASDCEVYTGTRVVAATVLRWPNVLDQCPDKPVQWHHVLRQCGRRAVTWADLQRECPGVIRDGTADHAEYRILQNLNTLVNNHNKNDHFTVWMLWTKQSNVF